MEFRLLGPLEVSDGGRNLPLRGAKLRALLTDLLIHSNEVVSVDRLVDDLWGDKLPGTAGNALQVYVSQLRKVLEPGRRHGAPGVVLQTVPPGYLLRVGRDQVDVTRFEHLFRRGHELLKSEPAEATLLLQEALSLWRGPALADVADEAFARPESARLEDLRIVALEDRVEAELALGRHSDLVGELEVLVKRHPLRERLCGLLMLCLYHSGRQAEASTVYHQTRERLVEEVGMEPGPELQQLLEQILAQDPTIAAPPTRGWSRTEKTNLPFELSSFVGRLAEIEELKKLLGEARLVTLAGAGGIGKTRLALAVASQLLGGYTDGVWLVELAAVTDQALVPQVVLATLDFGADPGRTPMESLIGVLTGREMLCVIDNCEHLVEACARLADTLLRHCPRLRILATSRDVLGVEGEIIWRVPSLATRPERPGDQSRPALARLEAVQLFVERAAAVRRSFRLTDDNAASVARICQRIEGIPLAIELAAAQVRGMSVAAIEEHLGDCFQLLTGGSRVSTPRQRTLQATLDWSHDLLADDEKRLFRRLSVFLGGFRLEAAETICGDAESHGSGVSVFGDLTSLVDKSLVLWEEGSDQSGRYRLLEPVRQYGRNRLLEASETDLTQRRHALLFLAFGEEVYRGLQGPRQPAWVARVEDELDNLRACFEWALLHDPTAGLRLVLALERYWTVGHFLGEGRDWLNRALQAAPDQDELRANGLYNASWLAFFQGDYDEARSLGGECLSLAQRLGSDRFIGQALTALASVEMAKGREVWVSVSLPLCEQAEQHLRRANDPVTLARQLNNIGTVLQAAGDLIGAKGKLEEAVELARELGDRWLIVNNLDGLAGIEFDTGDTAAAQTHWKEALALAGEIRSRAKAMLILIGLAVLAQANGQPRRCLRLLGAAATLQRRIGWVLSSASPAMARPLSQAQHAAHGLIGQEAADTAWREGARMSLADAIRYAVEELPPVLTAQGVTAATSLPSVRQC